MAQYIYIWMTVAVLAALAELISPGGRQGRLTGHVRFIAGLCVLVALLPAVKEGISRVKTFGEDGYEIILPDGKQDYGAYFEEGLEGITREQCEKWVYDVLEGHFAIQREDVGVLITVNTPETGYPEITGVSICLYGKAMLKDPHEIQRYIEACLGVPCTISVDLKKVSG